MGVSSLADGLTYRGEMTSVKQTYYIFEAKDHYFVMSFSKPRSGNFNIVDKKAVNYVYDRFGGKKDVTAKDVVERAKRTRHASTSLMALNILYILVAIGFADHRSEGSRKELHFSIKRARPNQALHLTGGA